MKPSHDKAIGKLIYNGQELKIKYKDDLSRLSQMIDGSLTELNAENFGEATEVRKYAFYEYKNLIKIHISDKIESIGQYAFANCTNVKKLYIGKSALNFLPVSSFAGVDNLDEIKVSEENTKYDSRNNCNCLIETSKNILHIGSNNSFIPDGVVELASNVFRYKTFTTISIPNTVTKLGRTAFYGSNK